MKRLFGNILVDEGTISQRQLSEALSAQVTNWPHKKPIGRVLAIFDYIGLDDIKRVLKIQYPKMTDDELEKKVSLDKIELDKTPTRHARISADVSIAIESVNGHESQEYRCDKCGYAPLGGSQLNRDKGETDEQFAHRVGKAAEQLVLRLIKEFPDKKTRAENRLQSKKPQA